MNFHLLVQGGLVTAEQRWRGTSHSLAGSANSPPAHKAPQRRLVAWFTGLAVPKRRQQPEG